MANVVAVVGMQWGDEGKGSIVEALTRQLHCKLVCRFNGGGQAGHAVTLPDGRRHIFSQFGSGTLAGAATHLSRFMVVDPLAAMNEESALRQLGIWDAFSRMTIEETALVATPFHIATNRLREMSRGPKRHGSCGMGIGETVADSLAGHDDVVRAFDLLHPTELRRKLKSIQERKYADVCALAGSSTAADFTEELGILKIREVVDWLVGDYAKFLNQGVSIVTARWLPEQLANPGHILFEGAQGVLLDQDYGFYPHCTWSDCTFGSVDRLVYGACPVRRLGVLRAFSTRHGAGPFPTERPDFARLGEGDHNQTNEWQGSFRIGAFDSVLAEYACSVVGHLDGLCITCVDRVDRLGPTTEMCRAYKDKPGSGCTVHGLLKPEELSLECQESTGKWLQQVVPLYAQVDTASLPRLISERLGVPLAIISRGPMAHQKEIL
jgi:adenylosuccinate synthase